MLSVASLNEFLESHEFTRRPGFRVTSAGDGECQIQVPYASGDDRPDGIVGGFVLMRAADVAFWLAIKTRLGFEVEFVTSSMTTHFLRPARPEDFVCSARLLKSGRRLVFGEAQCSVGERGLSHHLLTFVPVG